MRQNNLMIFDKIFCYLVKKNFNKSNLFKNYKFSNKFANSKINLISTPTYIKGHL